NLAIGYAENSALPLGSYTAFAGQPVTTASILVKYTRGADSDLDGIVGNSDVTIVGGKFGAAGSGQWYFGDFDYSGSCDNADVTALGGLFNPSAAPLAPVTDSNTGSRTASPNAAQKLLKKKASLFNLYSYITAV